MIKHGLWSALFLAAAAAPVAPDPYLWLEDVYGAKPMAWVKAENARALQTLQSLPYYARYHHDALAIANAADRVPAPAQIDGQIYNFWQDKNHVRGIWRRTTPESYRSANPVWTVILDIDALARTDHANYVWKGADCAEPAEQRCLISLSDGGEDAVTMREFDIATGTFVSGGFTIPRAKISADWNGQDQILLATDWGAGSMTQSGYPFIVKSLKRGQKLEDAQEVFRGRADDVSTDVVSLDDGSRHHFNLIREELDAFHAANYLMTAGGLQKLDLPQKTDILTFIGGQLVLRLNEDWAPSRQDSFKAGSLVGVDLLHQDHHAQLIFAPGDRQSVEQVHATRDRLIATIYDNVRGSAVVFTPGKSWQAQKLDLPENNAITIVSSTLRDDQFYLGVTGYLTPTSLWLGDTTQMAATQIKSSPARFDASHDVVEQFFAKAPDGVDIPYYIAHRRGIAPDGKTPTILYAYGGFGVSLVPTYQPYVGKLWLEQGGSYVVANIRGGGEFGPAWHEAALKTKRQTAYDDFYAVARDLGKRGFADAAHLGIAGGSNGGLLMGVAFTQHPEMWGATVIEVPLLDMEGFEHIAAGTSWVGEYGSMSVPAERANLQRISPYAHLRADQHYPEPFIYTTTKDDRVGPQHARKFAAKMQELKLPYLYYEAIEGGHSAGVNADEVATERSLEMAYFTRQLMPKAK